MLSREHDPIVACATPWGHGAIAVVRLSGPDVRPLITQVCSRVPGAWRAARVTLRDAAGPFDEGLLTWMPAPRSYTGEDVAEVSCHGNPALVERLIAAFVAQGARIAAPGEFTRRALTHGKLDLCRAEAVLQAIEASSPAGLELAWAGLGGAVSELAESARQALLDLSSELEALLDYPEEGLLFASDAEIGARLGAVHQQLTAALAGYRAGRLAVDGAVVALIGPVNAGKSSLFNRLLGRDRALVSPTPGTTRDVIEAPLLLDTVRITLADTAGQRTTDDPLEAAGIALSAEVVTRADLLLVVVPGHLPISPETRRMLDATAHRPRLVVLTFADRAEESAIHDVIRVDNLSGFGLDTLRDALPRALRGEDPGGVSVVLGSARQRDRLLAAARQIQAAQQALSEAGPAVAVELIYDALAELSALLGRDNREDTLDRLFSRFCIGK